MKITYIVAAVSLIIPSLGVSAVPAWFSKVLKVENPKQLAYYASASNACPISTQELKDEIEGIMSQNNIKPLTDWENSDLFLSATLDCSKYGNEYIYVARVNFARWNPKPGIIYDHPFDNYGSGLVPQYLSSQFRRKVGDAMNEFVKANAGS